MQRERERERAYCPLHFHTRVDVYLKHICNEKNTHTHNILAMAQNSCTYISLTLTLDSCFNIGRKTSVKTLFDDIEALSSFTP